MTHCKGGDSLEVQSLISVFIKVTRSHMTYNIHWLLEGTHLSVLLMLSRKKRLLQTSLRRFIILCWLKLSVVLTRYLSFALCCIIQSDTTNVENFGFLQGGSIFFAKLVYCPIMHSNNNVEKRAEWLIQFNVSLQSWYTVLLEQ